MLINLIYLKFYIFKIVLYNIFDHIFHSYNTKILSAVYSPNFISLSLSHKKIQSKHTKNNESKQHKNIR